jgi:hypothetical protein
MTWENLQELAKEVGGNLWKKNGLCRIYVDGGNNYQYRGKWYYDIEDDGCWEAKCYLEHGYSNKNREQYVEKYLKEMESNMIAAVEKLQKTETKTTPRVFVKNHTMAFDKTLEKMQACPPLPIIANPNYHPKNTPIRSIALLGGEQMNEYYQGCGHGVAYVKEGKVIAFRYDNTPEPTNIPEGCKIHPVEFSCTEICFRYYTA